MNQVFAHRMPPVHIAPIPFVRIMLIEKMILAFIINQAVRVIIPSSALGIMDLRAVCLFIKTVLSGYFICLINLVQSGNFSRIRDFQLFPFKRGYIAKHPVIRLRRSQSDIKGPDPFPIDSQCHYRTFLLMGNRKIQISLRNLQCNIFRIHTGGENQHHS